MLPCKYHRVVCLVAIHVLCVCDSVRRPSVFSVFLWKNSQRPSNNTKLNCYLPFFRALTMTSENVCIAAQTKIDMLWTDAVCTYFDYCRMNGKRGQITHKRIAHVPLTKHVMIYSQSLNSFPALVWPEKYAFLLACHICLSHFSSAKCLAYMQIHGASGPPRLIIHRW